MIRDSDNFSGIFNKSIEIKETPDSLAERDAGHVGSNISTKTFVTSSNSLPAPVKWLEPTPPMENHGKELLLESLLMSKNPLSPNEP
jgi:hypothetical protein